MSGRYSGISLIFLLSKIIDIDFLFSTHSKSYMEKKLKMQFYVRYLIAAINFYVVTRVIASWMCNNKPIHDRTSQ